MDELFNQTKSFFVNQTLDAKKFTKGIAFNVIPHIDVFMDDGSTKEEWKMVVETKKILDPKIKVHATCVRVPVFIGHAEAVNLELERPLDEHEARRVLAAAPGVLVGRPPRERRLRHAAGSHRPGRRVREPRARRSDGRQRPLALDRQRQPAQGRGAERRADRRGADPGLHLVEGFAADAWFALSFYGSESK